jgi:hypothetical protein
MIPNNYYEQNMEALRNYASLKGCTMIVSAVPVKDRTTKVKISMHYHKDDVRKSITVTKFSLQQNEDMSSELVSLFNKAFKAVGILL